LGTLITIKSKTELIGDVIALLQSPVKNVISALQSGGNILARGTGKRYQKKRDDPFKQNKISNQSI